jgi:hypothetical protein
MWVSVAGTVTPAPRPYTVMYCVEGIIEHTPGSTVMTVLSSNAAAVMSGGGGLGGGEGVGGGGEGGGVGEGGSAAGTTRFCGAVWSSAAHILFGSVLHALGSAGAVSQEPRTARPGRHCSPHHPPHCKPSHPNANPRSLSSLLVPGLLCGTDLNLKYHLTVGQITETHSAFGQITKFHPYSIQYEVLHLVRSTYQALVASYDRGSRNCRPGPATQRKHFQRGSQG